MNNDQLDRILSEAEKAFAENDKRKGLTNILLIFREDFTNEPAWKLLYKVMGAGKTFEAFQMEMAKKYFPDKVHLLLGKELDDLMGGIKVGNHTAPLPPSQAKIPGPTVATHIHTETTAPRYCVHCGSKIYTQGDFCPACGSPLRTSRGYTTAPANPQQKPGTQSAAAFQNASFNSGVYQNTTGPGQPPQQNTGWNAVWDKKNILPLIILAALLLILLITPLSIIVVIAAVILLIFFMLQKFQVIGGQDFILAFLLKYITLFKKGTDYVSQARVNQSPTAGYATNINYAPLPTKTKPFFRFTGTYFLAELGLILLFFSFFVPWFHYSHTTFLIINDDQTFYAKTLMAEHGEFNFDKTVLFFYILTCFAYLLTHSRIKILALLSGLGAIGFQIYNLSKLNSIANISGSSYDFAIPESLDTAMGTGAYLAMGAIILIVIGIVIGLIKNNKPSYNN